MKLCRLILPLLLCLSLCLGLSACGGSSQPAASEPDEAADVIAGTAEENLAESEVNAEEDYKVFVYGTDSNSTTFNPASDLQTNSGNFLVHAVGETLWTCDTEGAISYRLAESMEYSAESLNISLRQGVKFSNGDPMTASDVIFTFRLVAAQPRTASMYACMDLAGAEIIDDYTLKVPMNYYDAALVDLLGHASNMILDEEVAGAEGYSFDWLIGTGPYMLKGDGISDKSGWEESVSYTLVRNPYYWGDEPYYDEFDVVFYSQEATRYADLQSGKLDAAYLTEGTYINKLSSNALPGISLVTADKNAAVFYFEMARSLGGASGEPAEASCFADINVRKAFAHCLDIPTMVSVLGEGTYELATSLVGESSWIYEELPVYEYDPELAAACLQEAGYSVDNPLEVDVYVEGSAWASALFESAQSYCSAIGINLNLAGVADFATILPILISNEAPMSYGAASNGSGNDPANLLQQFGPESDNTMLRVTDEHLAELFRAGASSQDQDERKAIYQEFIEEIYEQYLAIPVCVGTKSFGVRDEHTSFSAAIDTSNQVDPVLLSD